MQSVTEHYFYVTLERNRKAGYFVLNLLCKKAFPISSKSVCDYSLLLYETYLIRSTLIIPFKGLFTCDEEIYVSSPFMRIVFFFSHSFIHSFINTFA